MILVDAFCGVGGAPLRLSSLEFFEICRARLMPEGILAVNVMPGEALVSERLRTIACSFPSTYVHQGEGTLVAFGSGAERVPMDDLLRRAVALQTRHHCEFSFPTLVRSLGPVVGAELQPLTDATPPDRMEIPEHLLCGVRPHDPCPCGGGKVFARCHGRPRS